MLSMQIIGLNGAFPRWEQTVNYDGKDELLASVELAERIKKAIKKIGKSKTWVAKQLQVTPQAVSGWEKTGRIRKGKLHELGRLAGEEMTWLITGAEVLGVKSPEFGPLLGWKNLMNNKKAFFSLKVETDAMSGKIPEGSVINVDASLKPEIGDIVVASLSGKTPVLREYSRDGDNVVLRATTSHHSPIVAGETDVLVLGVVVGAYLELRSGGGQKNE